MSANRPPSARGRGRGRWGSPVPPPSDVSLPPQSRHCVEGAKRVDISPSQKDVRVPCRGRGHNARSKNKRPDVQIYVPKGRRQQQVTQSNEQLQVPGNQRNDGDEKVNDRYLNMVNDAEKLKTGRVKLTVQNDIVSSDATCRPLNQSEVFDPPFVHTPQNIPPSRKARTQNQVYVPPARRNRTTSDSNKEISHCQGQPQSFNCEQGKYDTNESMHEQRPSDNVGMPLFNDKQVDILKPGSSHPKAKKSRMNYSQKRISKDDKIDDVCPKQMEEGHVELRDNCETQIKSADSEGQENILDRLNVSEQDNCLENTSVIEQSGVSHSTYTTSSIPIATDSCVHTENVNSSNLCSNSLKTQSVVSAIPGENDYPSSDVVETSADCFKEYFQPNSNTVCLSENSAKSGEISDSSFINMGSSANSLDNFSQQNQDTICLSTNVENSVELNLSSQPGSNEIVHKVKHESNCDNIKNNLDTESSVDEDVVSLVDDPSHISIKNRELSISDQQNSELDQQVITKSLAVEKGDNSIHEEKSGFSVDDLSTEDIDECVVDNLADDGPTDMDLDLGDGRGSVDQNDMPPSSVNNSDAPPPSYNNSDAPPSSINNSNAPSSSINNTDAPPPSVNNSNAKPSSLNNSNAPSSSSNTPPSSDNSSKEVSHRVTDSVTDVQVDTMEERELEGSSDKGDEDEDDESWDKMFDDDGECLDPNALEELTSAIGKVKIKKPVIDYLNYQPRAPEIGSDEMNHVIEIYDFPAEFKTEDLVSAFQDYKSKGFDIKWVDDTHALGVFNSPVAAQSALSLVHPLLKVGPLSEATKQSKLKAKRCVEFLQPYKPRPETSAITARRLVTGALGLAPKVSREQRDMERQKLKQAKEKKKLMKKQKDDIWEGTCTSNKSETS